MTLSCPDVKSWQALNDNSVVVFFNVNPRKLPQGSANTVLAFETQTPDVGGYVPVTGYLNSAASGPDVFGTSQTTTPIPLMWG